MNNPGEVLLDWDKIADVLYVVRTGYDLDALINVDSERVPGFVKRIDPVSRECVGFLVNSFSLRFPKYVSYDMEHLRFLMDLSLKLTNERTFLAGAKVA